MVSLIQDPRRPRALLGLWLLFLGAPMAWAAALGVLFSLTDETCVSGHRDAQWLSAALGLALAVLPGLVAWPLWRKLLPSTRAAERARFMLGVALGGSVLFTLVMLVSMVPVGLLDPCRT
jgi:hypothetical protein